MKDLIVTFAADQFAAALYGGNPQAAQNACVMLFIAEYGRNPLNEDGTTSGDYEAFADRLRDGFEERLQLEADERADAAEDFDPHEF